MWRFVMGCRCMSTEFSVLGTGGEHLVCADLIRNGYWAYFTSAALPYDVVLDAGGKLLRVQVKTAVEVRPRSANRPRKVYRFYAKNIDKCVDLMAFVALDIFSVAYIPLELCPSGLNLDGPDPEPHFNKKGPKTGCKTFTDFPLALALWHHNKQHVAFRDGVSVHVNR